MRSLDSDRPVCDFLPAGPLHEMEDAHPFAYVDVQNICRFLQPGARSTRTAERLVATGAMNENEAILTQTVEQLER